MSTNFFTSTNLITDLKFKQQVGVKADSFEEALAILNQEENKLKNPDDLKIELEKRDELQINAKLFMKSFSTENALKAVQTLRGCSPTLCFPSFKNYTWNLKLGGSFDNTLCTNPKENSTK